MVVLELGPSARQMCKSLHMCALYVLTIVGGGSRTVSPATPMMASCVVLFWATKRSSGSCVYGHSKRVVNVQPQLASSTRGTFMRMPCACVTLSAPSLQAVAEGLRSAGGMEAATRSLGTAAGWGGAAATTEALATLA